MNMIKSFQTDLTNQFYTDVELTFEDNNCSCSIICHRLINLDYDQIFEALSLPRADFDADISAPKSENYSVRAPLEELEKILLHAFFYGQKPPVLKRPLDGEGKKYPISIQIDTFLENYF